MKKQVEIHVILLIIRPSCYEYYET